MWRDEINFICIILSSLKGVSLILSIFLHGQVTFAQSKDNSPKPALKDTPTTAQEEPTKVPATGTESPASEKKLHSKETWLPYDQQSRINSPQEIAAELTGGILVEEIVEPAVTFHYSAFDKRDPFIAPYFKASTTTDTLHPVVSLLENYELGDLKIVGMWRNSNNQSKVLVMTKKNEGIIVGIGDPIGKSNGKVISIHDHSITVRQYLPGTEGSQEFEDIDMQIEPPEGPIDLNVGSSVGEMNRTANTINSALNTTTQKNPSAEANQVNSGNTSYANQAAGNNQAPQNLDPTKVMSSGMPINNKGGFTVPTPFKQGGTNNATEISPSGLPSHSGVDATRGSVSGTTSH